MSQPGLITIPSTHDVAATLHRLRAALTAKGITLFAEIDHAGGAAHVGLTLRPTTLLIFGNAIAGTPLMQAAQTSGIDLPLKILIWQDAQGVVQLSWNDPAWIAARHGAGEAIGPVVTALAAGVRTLAEHAAGA